MQPSKSSHFLFALLASILATSPVASAAKAAPNDTVTIISDPPGARVEIDGRFLGITPINWRVGNWALNPRKSTAYSKHLGVPVVMTVMKEGFALKTIRLTGDPIPWSSLNGANHFEYYIIQSVKYRVQLDRGMSNEDVLQLRNGGLSEDLIISKIISSPTSFLLDNDHLFGLKRAGISDGVVAAMLEAQRRAVRPGTEAHDARSSDEYAAQSFAAVTIAEPPPPPAPPEPGTRSNGDGASKVSAVRFTSDPPDAEVDIDGEYWGSTPTAEIQMKPGAHTIAVKKRGYQGWERKITITPGDARVVNAELEVEQRDPSRPKITGLDKR